jgi:hypothetical protein
MDSADTKPAIATNGYGAHEAVSKNLRAHDISPAEFSEKRYDPETLEIDHVAEKKLVRKLDLFIVPPVMLLYLFVSIFFLTQKAKTNAGHGVLLALKSSFFFLLIIIKLTENRCV